MVLFLFVVMMLDVDHERLREGFWRNLPVAVVVGGIMALEMVAVLAERYFGAATRTRGVPADYSNTRALGRVLYTQYVYAFEIAAVILLVAIIAAIALTLRRRKDTKGQDPAAQVAARREERVRLVSMPAEKDR
jgi:NADH-quinone oxidoreductase subunit J